MKLSKQKIKLHEQAIDLLKKHTLKMTEREFVFENYQPSYDELVGKIAAFFTPINMTYAVAMYTPESGTLVDIAAGIGGLSRAAIDTATIQGCESLKLKVVCVERNQRFLEVGRKLVPEATWVQGDIFDKKLWDKLGQFDFAVSNPPFGQIGQTKGEWLKYNGVADLMTLGVAIEVANAGTFILPQGSCPFEYSGRQCYLERKSKTFSSFLEGYPTCTLSCSSVDTSAFASEWVDASPKVEILSFENP